MPLRFMFTKIVVKSKHWRHDFCHPVCLKKTSTSGLELHCGNVVQDSSVGKAHLDHFSSAFSE